MATPSAGTYEVWLTEKLISVSSDIDTDIFVSYIIGILDNEGDDEEKVEDITGLLEGVMESDLASEVSKAITQEWASFSEKNKQIETNDDLGEKLSEIMGKHTLATVKEKHLSAEEKARKQAILAQYGEISEDDGTDEEDSDDGEDNQGGGGLLAKNTNKQMVDNAMKEAREKSKQEAEKKKEKDKQDRSGQKQKDEERKQAEKKRTMKGEKRR